MSIGDAVAGQVFSFCYKCHVEIPFPAKSTLCAACLKAASEQESRDATFHRIEVKGTK